MSWTTPADLRRQVERLWTRGLILKAIVTEDPFFPRRLIIKVPASNEMDARYNEVRAWLTELRGCPHIRLIERRIRFHSVGQNDFPTEVWVDTEDDATTWLGKKREAEVFRALVDETRQRHPVLLEWLSNHPFPALTLAESWSRLLDVVDWCIAHPLSNMYIRQVDIPGIDTKFIEGHKGVLYDCLNLALPPDSINGSATGAKSFNLRFGFRNKPLRVRLRILDQACSPLAYLPLEEQDFQITGHALSRLHPIPERVFVTENEINFLVFPSFPRSWIIFGAGYGFEALKKVMWLKKCRIYYWGDIDTHGFAALDQFRADFPDAQSFLMDDATLQRHSAHWVVEKEQTLRSLPRLNVEEKQVYDDLCVGVHGNNIRLEQERISMQWLNQSLDSFW